MNNVVDLMCFGITFALKSYFCYSPEMIIVHSPTRLLASCRILSFLSICVPGSGHWQPDQKHHARFFFWFCFVSWSWQSNT